MNIPPIRLALISVCLMFKFSGVAADENTDQRAAAIVSEWEQWVQKHNISEASVAVSYNGQLVGQQGIGRTATTPAPVASLTKSVTGICIAKLTNTDQLAFTTSLKSVVPDLDSDVSISTLLTHSSGFQTDITQAPDTYPGRNKEHLLWVSNQSLNAGQQAPAGESFAYNNANYAMLGAVISKLTNKTYEQACNELVFIPAGVENATLNPDWRIMSSWGGWKLSAVSFLKFIDTYYADSKVMTRTTDELPHYDFDGGVSYGMGVFFRDGRNGGTNFWHDGKWHTDQNGVKYRFASYFAKWDNGWAVSTNHNISAINNEHAELDQLLATAAHKP